MTPDQNINTFAGNGTAAYKGDGARRPTPASTVRAVLPWTPRAASTLPTATTTGFARCPPTGPSPPWRATEPRATPRDGGPAASADLNPPQGVAVDGNGNLFIADYNNGVIREVTTTASSTRSPATRPPATPAMAERPLSATLNYPTGVAWKRRLRLYRRSRKRRDPHVTPAAPSIARRSGQRVGLSAVFRRSRPAPGSRSGSTFAFNRRSWTAADFTGANAPASLDGTSVTIGGQSAFVDYISGSQVNVQVPSGVGAGSQPVIVKSPAGGARRTTWYSERHRAGTVCAAPVQDRRHAVCRRAVPRWSHVRAAARRHRGPAFGRAKAGDTITLYGIGFGGVTPSIPAGQVVGQSNSLASNLVISFAGTPASVTYAGLEPNFIGLYQF